MNIGISTSVIQRGRTGIAQYLFALLRAFVPCAEHDFTLFVLEEDVPLFNFLADKMRIVRVPEKFRPPIKNILWHQSELPKLASQLGLSVLHVPSYRRLLWPKPCALVATIHDLAPFHVSGKYDWRRMFYGRVIARRLARRQDHIIAISQNTADDLSQFFGLVAAKISVIHNGLDHARFFPAQSETARDEIRRKHNFHQPFFLYLARLEHPGKNHVRLIEAFNQFKTDTHSAWQLVFGGADWHGSEVIHTAIADSPFAADIRCLGFVGDSDLPDLYRAADVFVYPSLFEGFGMPPIEAMACGCPVISSECGSLNEVVADAAALVEAQDAESIAHQLTVLAHDEPLRANLRSAGLARAQFFNWQKTARQTLAVYRQAVGTGTNIA